MDTKFISFPPVDNGFLISVPLNMLYIVANMKLQTMTLTLY